MMAMVELAVVIPTYNERGNVRPLLEALDGVLHGVDYEVLFVDDDSPDGTAEQVRALGRQDPRVRVLQRINRRGLSSACIEGMMATAAPYIAVMDADLQHDEKILPAMLGKLKSENLDVVVGSRNIEGGSMGQLERKRVAMSGLGRRVSRFVYGAEVTDPMSGFFVLRSAFLEEVVHDLSGIGFKILLDLLASSRRPVRLGEVPYCFRARVSGESKLDTLVMVEYFQLLLDKRLGNILPARFLLFAGVGLIGALLYSLTVGVLFGIEGLSFTASLGVATVIAMTSNFFLNNAITYRERRLTGWRILSGLFSFYLICALGAVPTIAITDLAQHAGFPWPLATGFGAIISSVWNFGATSAVTWRAARRRFHRRASNQGHAA